MCKELAEYSDEMLLKEVQSRRERILKENIASINKSIQMLEMIGYKIHSDDNLEEFIESIKLNGDRCEYSTIYI